MAITEIGSTLIQMGRNAVSNPGEFVGYGLSQTGKAAANALPKMPTLKPPSERDLPDVNTQNGDVLGSRYRDSFESSGSATAKHPKQQAFNMVAPGQSNIHGGSFELIV